METLTSELPGVAVFQDDMLFSGQLDANGHLRNPSRLLSRLNDKRPKGRHETCLFEQPSMEYLSHNLSADGITKGSKAEAVIKMPAPMDVSSLRSLLGSVQFHRMFILNLSTTAEILYRLIKKATVWK